MCLWPSFPTKNRTHDSAAALELEISAARGEGKALSLSQLEAAVRMLNKAFLEATEFSTEAAEAAAKCKVS